MSLIAALVNLVYRALFLRGEEGFRLSYTWSKLLYLASGLLVVTKPGAVSALVVMGSTLPLSVVWPGWSWLYSALVLSLIPAAWFSLTAYVSGYVGLPGVDAVGAVVVLVRSLAVSLLILFLAAALSPVKVANILLRLRAPGYYPLLTWRTIPYGLRVLVDSIHIGVLKREKPHRRLAPAVAIMLEYGGFVEEYNWLKVGGRVKGVLPTRSSAVHTALLTAASLGLVVLYVVLP